jgi:hypothetical protein
MWSLVISRLPRPRSISTSPHHPAQEVPRYDGRTTRQRSTVATAASRRTSTGESAPLRRESLFRKSDRGASGEVGRVRRARLEGAWSGNRIRESLGRAQAIPSSVPSRYDSRVPYSEAFSLFGMSRISLSSCARCASRFRMSAERVAIIVSILSSVCRVETRTS